jgi:adenosylcobyric acid synthase
VRLVLVRPGEAIPAGADLVVVPGTKSTMADLAFLRAQGWDIDIAAHRRRGGRVLGLCGGYQMLGKTIADPDGVEGTPGTSQGLGLLDVETVLEQTKALRLEDEVDEISGERISGYQMHMGRTTGPDAEGAFAALSARKDGARSKSGRVMGTYLHGLFARDGFRRMFLKELGLTATARLNYEAEIDAILDRLADHLETHLDLDALLEFAGEAG